MIKPVRPQGDRVRGVGPFVTWVSQGRADGRSLLRTSRRHRKGLAPVIIPSRDVDPRIACSGLKNEWLHFWAPTRSGWWIAVLFMVGAALFAAGGAQGAWPDSPAVQWIDPSLVGLVFFAGSLFFTAAAYLQWLEALNNDVTVSTQTANDGPRDWRFFGWRPRNLGYLAALVQLAGTVLFNLNTADALMTGLGWEQQDLLIWTPDMVGSICFLVASSGGADGGLAPLLVVAAANFVMVDMRHQHAWFRVVHDFRGGERGRARTGRRRSLVGELRHFRRRRLFFCRRLPVDSRIV